MYRRFFEDLLDSSMRRTKKGKRKLTLPVSIAVHVVILFAILVVPYMRYNELPEPALGAVQAFFVEPTTGPPPLRRRRRRRRPRWRPRRSAGRSR